MRTWSSDNNSDSHPSRTKVRNPTRNQRGTDRVRCGHLFNFFPPRCGRDGTHTRSTLHGAWSMLKPYSYC
eukprot:3109848-Prymnesium_polylepis.1